MVGPDSSLEERDTFAANLYREKVKPLLGEADAGKFVVMDLDSGDYEVDDYEFEAAIRLLERRPGADIYPFFGNEPSRIIYIGGASLRFVPSPHIEPTETEP